ncbi:MAG TPA: S9 family peptidase [Verrucomicrobiae bacterium]|nr:S9 family peptidase [Verrucomicrobiae bacterium]
MNSLARAWRTFAVYLLAAASGSAQVPDNLVVEGVPAITPELRKDVGRYLEFRSASFNSWHPRRREMLVSTRFADTPQLHLVKMPGGARRQLTFFAEPVLGGSFRPKSGEVIVFAQDAGGGEFYQLYRYDLADAKVTLLTDGKSRNSGPRWSNDGRRFAYTSTRRNGKDNDIYLMDPSDPKSDRKLIEVTGGGWRVLDWSPDDAKLLLNEYISINESYLWLADGKSGEKKILKPPFGKSAEKISWTGGQFAKDGRTLFVTTDKDSEFQRLCKLDLEALQRFESHQSLPPPLRDFPLTVLARNLKWDVEGFELSPDGRTLAFTSNEDGVSVMHLLDAKTGRELRAPKLPLGVIGGLEWHENSRDLGFVVSSARSPSDAYSLDVKTGKVERWTESETGGLNPETFVEPELIKLKSFDGLGISGFLYRPDPKKYPGPRPVIIDIHGGPEGQFRPVFQARDNYFLNELGVAILCPNVRGSDGYGKTFLTLDNGFKREDSVKDIGAFIDWIQTDRRLDGARVAVTGASYGGYMTLASMTHFNARLSCGVDIVGISSFLTFLKNTQDYRRDLRRAEYGDERDPKMAEHLEKISPMTNVKKITKPMFVVQGFNDPRVPMTESEQMVKAMRENSAESGGQIWYLMARDEGHGFRKKKNADFEFLSTILFYREHLLK